MAPALNDVFQISYRARLFGQRILTVLHYYLYSNAPSGTIEAACKDIALKFSDATFGGVQVAQKLIACQCPEIEYEAVRAQRVAPSRSIYEEKVMTGVAGTFAGASASSNLACSIEKVTTTPGRKGIGRVQIAGIDIGAMTEAKWAAAFVDAEVKAFGDAMLLNVTVPPTNFVLAPCLYNPTGGAPFFSPITEYRLQYSVRTMHRRTFSVGE